MHKGDYLIGEHPKTHGYPGENETKTDREGPLPKFLIHSITNILIISERNKNVLVNMKEKHGHFCPCRFESYNYRPSIHSSRETMPSLTRLLSPGKVKPSLSEYEYLRL